MLHTPPRLSSSHIFFPQGDAAAATSSRWAMFAIAFVARPIVRAIRPLGDRVGRKVTRRLAADYGHLHRGHRPAAGL